MSINSDIVILYRHRAFPFDGLDTFNKELEKHYFVKQSPHFMPAAGGNHEMWFEIIIKSSLINYLANIVKDGLTWDLIKLAANSVFLEPLFKALENLSASNQSGIEIQEFVFQFDDIAIKIAYVPEKYPIIIGQIFQQLLIHIPIIDSMVLGKLTTIATPLSVIDNSKSNQKWHIELFGWHSDIKDYLKYWGLAFNYDMSWAVYDVSQKAIIHEYWC